MKKPVIGITCNTLGYIAPEQCGCISAPGQDWELIAEDYVRSLDKAGACPVLLPVHTDFEANRAAVERVDGLLISGGHDVTPSLFGERYSVKCGPLDPRRDEYEIALIKWADENDVPLLGICRGIQVMNVAFGGTLCQDIINSGRQSHSLWSGDRDTPTHLVNFPEESPLRGLYGCESMWVNSFHHQAIRRLAEGLEATALSDFDEIVEGVIRPGRTFMMGIQWHPEMMYRSEQQAKLFTAFVEACAAKMAR